MVLVALIVWAALFVLGSFVVAGAVNVLVAAWHGAQVTLVGGMQLVGGVFFVMLYAAFAVRNVLAMGLGGGNNVGQSFGQKDYTGTMPFGGATAWKGPNGDGGRR